MTSVKTDHRGYVTSQGLAPFHALALALCLAVLLAVPGGEPCFAEESLAGRTILAKGSDSYVLHSFLNKGKVDGFGDLGIG